MEAISSNSSRKLLWSENTKMLTAVQKNKFIALFIIISFPILNFNPKVAAVLPPRLNSTRVYGPVV